MFSSKTLFDCRAALCQKSMLMRVTCSVALQSWGGRGDGGGADDVDATAAYIECCF